MTASRPTKGLCVTLFGAPELTLDGEPFALKAPPRTLPLLALLVLEGHPRSNARARLSSLLWPESEMSAARTNLRRHLHCLRTALSHAGVRTDDMPSSLSLEGSIAWCDVWAFDALLAKSIDRDATDLYRAPLLSTWSDDTWIAPYRDRYRRRFLDANLRLIATDRIAGRFAAALERTTQGLALEPHAHELMRAALDLSMEVGDARTGLVLYERFVERLRDDLDAEPDPETAALAERLRKSHVQSFSAGTDATVGRESEIREIVERLRTRRFVALCGLPGIGKTHLAETVFARERGRAIDGAFWIDVGRIEDKRSIEATLLQRIAALGPPHGASLVDRMADANMLLAFDECEGRVEELRALLVPLLRAAAGLRVMLTSTHRIEIGETAPITIGPLPIGDAVTLFEARAAESSPGSTFDAGERSTIASICTALDGIPLAILIAAGRARNTSLAALLEEVRTAAYPSVEGILVRALAVLSSEARALYPRLTIFRTAISDDVVATLMAIERVEARGLLDELADASLIVVSAGENATTYEMLESLRHLATGWLDERTRRVDIERHAEYFAERVLEIDDRLRGAIAFAAFDAIEPLYADISAAFDVMLDRDAMRAGQMCLALSRFWYDRNLVDEGISWTRRAIQRLRDDLASRALTAELLYILAWLQRNSGDYEASYRDCQIALEAMIAADLPRRQIGLGALLVVNAARMVGEYDDARKRAAAALLEIESLGETYLIGYAQLISGIVLLSAGDVDTARGHLVTALRAYEATGAKADAALACLNLVECAHAQGELDLAETLAREASQRSTDVGNWYFLAHAKHGLSLALVRKADWPAVFHEVPMLLRSAKEFGDRDLVLLCAELIAELASSAGRYTTAALLLGAADAEREAIKARRHVPYQIVYDRLWKRIVERLGPNAAAHAREIGSALDRHDLPVRLETTFREIAAALHRARARAPSQRLRRNSV